MWYWVLQIIQLVLVTDLPDVPCMFKDFILEVRLLVPDCHSALYINVRCEKMDAMHATLIILVSYLIKPQEVCRQPAKVETFLLLVQLCSHKIVEECVVSKIMSYLPQQVIQEVMLGIKE